MQRKLLQTIKKKMKKKEWQLLFLKIEKKKIKNEENYLKLIKLNVKLFLKLTNKNHLAIH